MSEADDEDAFYNEHAAIMGLVSLAWNDCHSLVLEIFHTLSGMNWQGAQAVFLSVMADRAQRRMTVALMNAVLTTDNDASLRELGISLLNQLDKMAGERNAACRRLGQPVHAACAVAVSLDLGDGLQTGSRLGFFERACRSTSEPRRKRAR